MTSCISSSKETWEGDLPVRSLGSMVQEPAQVPDRIGEIGGQALGSMVQGQALKVAVIREELVALTGDPLIAVILNQLLYWTQRVKDFDLLLEEERAINNDCNVAPRHGWIYKSAEDLAEETMLRVSRFTIRRYLTFLMEKRWIDERINSHNKWDKTTQYRVNLKKLQGDLFALGYSLHGFSVGEVFLKTHQLEVSKTAETSSVQNAPSSVQNDRSSVQNAPSNVKNCSFIYLNRDYSEIINRDHAQNARAFQKISDQNKEKSLFEKAIKVWRCHLGQEVALTPEREQGLSSLLSLFFQNDLREWEKFCERIKASPFLMGQGLNKWHVTFDWILLASNALKVLEGNFDSSEGMQHKQTETDRASREQIRKEILKSIKDPVWKEWCVQLSEACPPISPIRSGTWAGSWATDPRSNQISLFELEELSGANFMEFDGRLVWVRCPDQKTLNRIESVRLKLLFIVQKQFPQARNIRAQIEEENNEGALPSDFSEKLMTNLHTMTTPFLDVRSGSLQG